MVNVTKLLYLDTEIAPAKTHGRAVSLNLCKVAFLSNVPDLTLMKFEPFPVP